MSREHENRIVIRAPLADVWRALTDPAELARWFAPHMSVVPGPGGSVLADWGPGLEWRTTIEVWDPPAHLRLVETRDRVMSADSAPQPLPPCRLVQDYYLSAAGGATLLRLVHSGFGDSADWDQEYEGTRCGWASCFLRLQHTLERHPAAAVSNSIVTALCQGVDWNRAIDRVETALPPSAQVLQREQYHLTVLLPEWNGSIITISLQPSPGGSVAYVELLLYGVSSASAASVQAHWRATLDSLFPVTAGSLGITRNR